MNKIEFTSVYYHYGLVFLLTSLILYESFFAMASGSPVAIAQVLIQFILYFLVATQHRWTKRVLQLWVLLFLMAKPLMRLFAQLLQEANTNFEQLSWWPILLQLSFAIAGILTLAGAERYIRTREA